MIYLYGISTQTCKLSHAANTLNFVLHSLPNDGQLLGLKEVVGNVKEYMSALEIDGHRFTVCAVKEDTRTKRWEDEDWTKEEQDLIDQGYVWLVTMPGCDDHCGYTRFKTLEDAKKWYVSDESINYDSSKYWMVN